MTIVATSLRPQRHTNTRHVKAVAGERRRIRERQCDAFAAPLSSPSLVLLPQIPTMMLRPLFRPLERCFGRWTSSGDCLLWNMDLKPHACGDFSIAVVQANSSLEDQAQVFTSPFATYVGVYDGHGGPEASRFLNSRLFPHLHRLSVEQGGLSEDVIKKALGATEEEFLQVARRSWLSRPKIAAVGSCCLVGAIAEGVIYVANLGDSRAVLGRRSSAGGRDVVPERLSKEHNVAHEDVRKELRELHPDDSHIVVFNRGAWRVKGIIQVSRSIGDMYLKKPELSRDPIFRHNVSPIPLKRPVMTAEPSIHIHKVKKQDLFLIFASDGLWEQLTDEDAVEIVVKNPRAGIAKRLVRAALHEAARKREMSYHEMKRIEKGMRRYFHDDITVIVIYLDHPPRGSGRFKSIPAKCTSAPVDIFSLNSDEPQDTLLQI